MATKSVETQTDWTISKQLVSVEQGVRSKVLGFVDHEQSDITKLSGDIRVDNQRKVSGFFTFCSPVFWLRNDGITTYLDSIRYQLDSDRIQRKTENFEGTPYKKVEDAVKKYINSPFPLFLSGEQITFTAIQCSDKEYMPQKITVTEKEHCIQNLSKSAFSDRKEAKTVLSEDEKSTFQEFFYPRA